MGLGREMSDLAETIRDLSSPYGRAVWGRCYKNACGSTAERFFLANTSAPGGPSFVALCHPCAKAWLSSSPGFRPIEVSRDEFLDLAQVAEVNES